MKSKALLTGFLFFVCLIANAQEKMRAKIGVTWSPWGKTDVFRPESLEGEAIYDGNNFSAFGITYVQPFAKWLELETGVEYAKYAATITPMKIDGMVSAQCEEKFQMLNIPVALRINFLKYFYLNGGIIVDLDLSDLPFESQTGLGAIFGFALKYDTKHRLSLFANPYAKFHSLLPFMPTENHQKLLENGLKIGITYRL